MSMLIDSTTANELMQEYCEVIPDEKPSRTAHKLAVLSNQFWTVIFANGKEMLEGLTYHKTQTKEKAKTDFSNAEVASLALNNFLRNIRVFGFFSVQEAYRQRNHQRVRPSAPLLPNVFHNHFGTRPEYVMEYEVYGTSTCAILVSSKEPKTLKHPENTAYYIRYQKKLYYKNTSHNVCTSLLVSQEQLTKFDQELSIESQTEDKARLLNEKELLMIAQITKYPHIQRVILVTEIDTHENFPFQKKSIRLTDFYDEYAQSKCRVLEQLDKLKNISEEHIHNDFKSKKKLSL